MAGSSGSRDLADAVGIFNPRDNGFAVVKNSAQLTGPHKFSGAAVAADGRVVVASGSTFKATIASQQEEIGRLKEKLEEHLEATREAGKPPRRPREPQSPPGPPSALQSARRRPRRAQRSGGRGRRVEITGDKNGQE